MTLALLLLAADLVPRPVWTGPNVTLLGAPAFDDSFLSAVDPATGSIGKRALRPNAKLEPFSGGSRGEFAYFSVPSRDGRQIAYAWFNSDGFYELRITNGTIPRTVYRNQEAGFVQPTSWTPDGKAVLTLLFRRDNTSQIAMIEVASGAVKVLRSLAWVYPKKIDLSPDGRWIVYDTFPGQTPGPRDIYLLAADGSREIRLTDHPADDLFPMFSPDGREIVFASDRRGSLDLYRLPVDGGDPRLLLKAPGRYLPLGVTRNGKLYYGVRAGSGPEIAIEGVNTGKLAAAVQRRASENHGLHATVLMLKAGNDAWRPLDLPLAHVEKAHWSPDGERLLVSATDGKGRAGLFIVDPKAASVQPLVLDEYATARGIDGVWTGPQRVAYAARNALRERDLTTGLEVDRAPLVALALASGKEGLVAATATHVVNVDTGQQWPVRGIQQVAWLAGRLIVTRGPSVAVLDARGAGKVDWPRYHGGTIHSSNDGSAIAYSIDDTKQEVWVIDNVWGDSSPVGR